MKPPDLGGKCSRSEASYSCFPYSCPCLGQVPCGGPATRPVSVGPGQMEEDDVTIQVSPSRSSFVGYRQGGRTCRAGQGPEEEGHWGHSGR